MNRKEVEKIIKTKFSTHSNTIVSLLRDTIVIETTNNIDNENSHSKFGGFPDLVNSIEWPKASNGVPLSFFAQIDLRTISMKETLLPSEGLLYFFVLTKGVENRYPDRKGEHRVIYSNHKIVNENYKPTKEVDEFQASKLHFSQSVTLPYNMDDCSYKSAFNNDEIEEIEEMNECYLHDYENRILHHMFGWPDTLQYSVLVLFALKYFNLEIDVLNDSIFEEKMIEESKNFHVLIQINFEDENTDFSKFGGESILYFGIHKEDLKNQNFDNTIILFQNT